MYWLLEESRKAEVRTTLEHLVLDIASMTERTQADQLFPFVGRKALDKSRAVIRALSPTGGLVVDPFSGSGTFTYAAELEGREVRSSEWEPYTHRMSSAPWRVPEDHEIDSALSLFVAKVRPFSDPLYTTICVCGSEIVFDSLFFDREPQEFFRPLNHERLGNDGENVTFRREFRCSFCGATQKHFDETDMARLRKIDQMPLSDFGREVFSAQLIENSRINITRPFTTYGRMFPKRSQLVLDRMWSSIHSIEISSSVRDFLVDAFLSIVPQAKFKDYRGKSQDLHVPPVKLREVNLLTRFLQSVAKRRKRLREYDFEVDTGTPIVCCDFRELVSTLDDGSVDLVFTDPPWTDGNAYFEKAQVYHPWLGYHFSEDKQRLANEVVVTDAPSRRSEHDLTRWWIDFEDLLCAASPKIKDFGFFALYFRPIPAHKWLHNLNLLKFHARKAGFEPLLSIDASSDDPSMRIQQSASFVFSTDLIFVLLKLPSNLQRSFVKNVDLDYLAFTVGTELQEDLKGPYTVSQWRREIGRRATDEGVYELNHPKNESLVQKLFERYCRAVSPTENLVRPDTPFNGQLFDIPVDERLFSFVPNIVRELTENDSMFSYDMFLLKLAGYVENGTRTLIESVEKVDVVRLLEPYAVPIEGGRWFKQKPLPEMPHGVSRLMDLDPYAFEEFTANLLRAQGFSSIAIMGGSGDRGVDVQAIDPDGSSVVVQCKRYLNNVGSDPIQRLHSFAVTRGADRSVVITTAGFTKQGKDEALKTGTELIDGEALSLLVARFLPDFLS